jgi:uncharacterized integral membrane protein
MVRRTDGMASEPQTPVADGSGPPDGPEAENRYEGTGVTPVMIVLSLVAVAFVIFIAQNTGSTPVGFLGWDVETSLAVVVLVTMVTTALLTLAVAAVWRRRRRKQRSEHEELRRLRRS